MKKRGETPDGPQSGATDEFGVAVHKVRVKPDQSKMPKKKVQKTEAVEEEIKEDVVPEPLAPKVFCEDANKFDDLPINDKLKQVLKENGYDQLTKIQKEVIPTILNN